MQTKESKKLEKLCTDFSLLDEKDQEYIFGILQALLFAKKKNEVKLCSNKKGVSK
jgi:hypothetical protein